MANSLGLQFDIIPSKRIKDPTHSHQSIGSVCINGLDLVSVSHDVPQDYIYHQVTMLKFNLRSQNQYYRGSVEAISLKDKVILLVDDKLVCENQILACLRSLHCQQPRKIIVATPVALPHILKRLKKEQCEVISLATPSHTNVAETFYEHLPKVTHEEVKQLFWNSRQNTNLVC
jgi:predicted phosphoribosyltransferase